MSLRLQFASVPAADQDRALAFYTEKLGMKLISDDRSHPMTMTSAQSDLQMHGCRNPISHHCVRQSRH